MINPRKTSLWLTYPVPVNPFPAHRFRSLGLGRETRDTAFYVPLHLPKNVKEVEMNMSKVRNGSRTQDLTVPLPSLRSPNNAEHLAAESLDGKGQRDNQHIIAEAFRHPIKVLCLQPM